MTKKNLGKGTVLIISHQNPYKPKLSPSLSYAEVANDVICQLMKALQQ
jgi:hypothetical protein